MNRLRVLAITNLFPSHVNPGYATFNRQQFAALGRIVDLEVFGIVPWRLGRYFSGGSSDPIAPDEWIDDVRVHHPRFMTIPGMSGLNAGFIASSLFARLWKNRKRFDVILGSYAYPDGCAAILLGGLLGLPVVVKCHGSDLNRVPQDKLPKLQLERLLPRAKHVVCVSQALQEQAVRLGVAPDRVSVVYNGVDRQRFTPRDKLTARRHVGLPENNDIVAVVSHLDVHKGTRDLLEAIPRLASLRPNVLVAFIGEGPLAREVASAAEHGGINAGRVIPVGRLAHSEIPYWMAAADVVCLPSHDEGMPNVVRESHAVGRPVVATAVGGIPEAVTHPSLGRLVPPRDPTALADALAAVLEAQDGGSEPLVGRAFVPTWQESASALADVLESAALTGAQPAYAGSGEQGDATP